ncbi:hypothetical protein E2C01_030972 [Portunus trituberculatus]|uniref:Uncharacterized protein n=1 Tax=Portunus trituberculatus TaxID=210409 RepID=A0A5B7ERU1_PORTR|nr:hypothetical protein [Portunus trituberculatus]
MVVSGHPANLPHYGTSSELLDQSSELSITVKVLKSGSHGCSGIPDSRIFRLICQNMGGGMGLSSHYGGPYVMIALFLLVNLYLCR